MFDQSAIIRHKSLNRSHIRKSDFLNFVYSDLFDRTSELDRKIVNRLIISYSESQEGFKSIAPADLELIEPKSMDLIYFPFGLHWINDVQIYLLQVKSVLKLDGIFICNFPVFGSLNNLRKLLLLSQENFSSPHFPHISPFIRFEDVASLMQQAGFVENIIDSENITIEYSSPIKFMKWLKKIGESNAILNRTNYSINKKMYKFLKNYDFDFFEDQIKLVTVIASPSKNSIKLRI